MKNKEEARSRAVASGDAEVQDGEQGEQKKEVRGKWMDGCNCRYSSRTGQYTDALYRAELLMHRLATMARSAVAICFLFFFSSSHSSSSDSSSNASAVRVEWKHQRCEM